MASSQWRRGFGLFWIGLISACAVRSPVVAAPVVGPTRPAKDAMVQASRTATTDVVPEGFHDLTTYTFATGPESWPEERVQFSISPTDDGSLLGQNGVSSSGRVKERTLGRFPGRQLESSFTTSSQVDASVTSSPDRHTDSGSSRQRSPARAACP